MGPKRPRIGVDAAHPNYRWWALSCTSLGMLLATINSGTRNMHTALWVLAATSVAGAAVSLLRPRHEGTRSRAPEGLLESP